MRIAMNSGAFRSALGRQDPMFVNGNDKVGSYQTIFQTRCHCLRAAEPIKCWTSRIMPNESERNAILIQARNTASA
jgi:hypothetical protein